jgi:glucokinase
MTLIGIDVGGTKIAAGLLAMPEGRILARRLQPTLPQRGGEAMLTDVIALVHSLRDEAITLGVAATAAGIGVAELVSPDGTILSAATIRWKEVAVGRRVESETSLPTVVDADVRAAARGEAQLGAGRGLKCFIYITVGTGISACLVLDGLPYTGARGLTGYFASGPMLIGGAAGELVAGPPLENFAAGPAIAQRFAAIRSGFAGAPADVLALASNGDAAASNVVDSAACALGAAVANLVSMLDPQAVVLGGGLGLAGGRYRSQLEESLRQYIYSDCQRDLPILDAQLGPDAGWIGAALCTQHFFHAQ